MNIQNFIIKHGLRANPRVIIGLRILILLIFFLVVTFMNTSVVLADPGWGGMGG